MSKYFITGTDTGVGKTFITCKLIHELQQQNKKVVALKPLASGCELTADGLRNDDALQIQKALNIKLPYELINPYAFQPPIAPSLAAQHVNQEITVQKLIAGCEPALNIPADVYLIEGVGGWHVPINNHESMIDFVKYLDLEVILVIGIRLGCINHALLTYQALQHAQVKIKGWLASYPDPNVLVSEEILQTLQMWLPAGSQLLTVR